MGWWIALGILVLLAALPLGVSARYDEGGAVVKVIVGPVKLTLFPRPKKEKKPPKEETEAKKKSASKKTKQKKQASEKKTAQNAQPPKEDTSAQRDGEKSSQGGSLTDFLPLVRIVLDFLSDFKQKLRVNYLELKLVLAGDDPCDLAVNYGRAWTAMGNLLPRLERFLVIKKRNLDVQCDFTASRTTVLAQIDLTITLGRLLAAASVFVVRALTEFLKIMNKRKGGTENEPKSS